MRFKKIVPVKEEHVITEDSEIALRQNSLEENYFKKIYKKPWGYEFLAYQNKNVGIWILTINKDQRTSLHCHFKKSSIIICLQGVAKIDTYNGYEILHIGDVLYADLRTFHGLGSYTDTCVLMEIELYNDQVTFTDKDDLLRIRDMYCREKTGYGNSVQELIVTDEILKTYTHFKFDENTSIPVGDTRVTVRDTITDIQNLNNKLIFLLDGKLRSNNQILYSGSFITDINDYLFLTEKCNFLIIENSFQDENKKIIYNNTQLKDCIKTFKEEEVIGLTSGCFDILHAGHLNFFRECKQYCSKLVVCLSSDKQIKSLKGENRPINSLKDRVDILKCISDIDYIILYDEVDNKIEKELDDIINIVEPEIWFKGSDYSETEIRKKHPSLKQIKIIPNIIGKSTTNIVTKIKDNSKL